jgi:hypothetical protein
MMTRGLLAGVVHVAACAVLAVSGGANAGEQNVPAWDDLPAPQPKADDWPWWRGPKQDNIAASATNPPLRWSATENIAWKAEAPGRGHGTPCVWGERIFVGTADERAQTQCVVCFDRKTGQKLWQTEVHSGGFMRQHKKNSHASSTPACDGERVYMPFMVQGGMWLTALSFDGKIAWQKKVGDFTSMHGYGASPLIYRSLVIVAADNLKGSYIAAVHRRTGEVVWRANRPDYSLGTYASPAAGPVAGRDQLVIQGPYKIFSYDPLTGKPFWTCDGPNESASSTVTLGGDLVFAAAGYPKRNMLCVRADGSGDVTKSHIVWKKENNNCYVPSLLLAGGLLYMVVDEGRVACFDAASGDVVWDDKLAGGFSSSPVLAGGHIYIVNEAGMMYVLKSGRTFEVVARNDLADGGFATPVILGDRIYLRTLHALYCIGGR